MPKHQKNIKAPRCPNCKMLMKRRYDKDTTKSYYYCTQGCDIYVSSHPNGTPVGHPVKREVRELRSLAHRLANKIWDYNNSATREKMYVWLQKHSLSGHFGQMDKEELVTTIDKIQRIIKRFKK